MQFRIYLILLVSILAYACKEQTPLEHKNSAYYWSTTFNADSTITDFMGHYQINRLYVRYFDVVPIGNGQCQPNATIKFASKVPTGIEIVPTIFILPECLNSDKKELANKILRRVIQMNSTNDITGVKELQIDCDWTVSTRSAYMAFMQLMQQYCHSKGLKLSATIRLHQLSQTPPPADRGVLMMYNTGDVKNSKCRNPILDMHDAAPYLRYLANYKLPISVAYPIFSWKVLFRGKQFVGIVHYDGEYPMLPDDSIATQYPTAEDLSEAIREVEKRRPEANRERIIYDISKKNIKLLKSHNYEKILYN